MLRQQLPFVDRSIASFVDLEGFANRLAAAADAIIDDADVPTIDPAGFAADLAAAIDALPETANDASDVTYDGASVMASVSMTATLDPVPLIFDLSAISSAFDMAFETAQNLTVNGVISFDFDFGVDLASERFFLSNVVGLRPAPDRRAGH